jgi:rare lipoprotein A
LQRTALVGLILLGAAHSAAGQTLEAVDRPAAAKPAAYSAVGWASWYGREFHGRRTADGEIFDMGAITAAHKTMPLPCYARVTNLNNGRSILVRVNDRGPYVGDRLIDVSARVADLLGFQGAGLTKVKVDYVSGAPVGGSDDAALLASLTTREQREDGVSAYAPTPPAKNAFAQSAALVAANLVANGATRTVTLDAPLPSPYGGLVPSSYGELEPWPADPVARPSLVAGLRP